MKNFKLFKSIRATVLIFLCCSCSGGCSVWNFAQENSDTADNSQSPVTLVNWNLQTFFDANKDGCEYQEFQKASDWNKEKYEQRLGRLCNVISTLDADIYVFEELENESIIYDISNILAGNGQNWNQKKFWNYSLFAKEEGTAIGIGILSRYPLSQAKVHSMDIRIHREKQPSLRYIVETTVSINNKEVFIFANHWKSKVGGEEKTEIWRDWQESILAKRLKELSGKPIIICGDFNRDAQAFICNFKESADYIQKEENTILRYTDFGLTDYTSAQSIWFDDYGNILHKTGSYIYEDSWERIDNIMTAGQIKITNSGPCISSPWSLAKDYPMSYHIYSGTGYSDHLPVMVQFIVLD